MTGRFLAGWQASPDVQQSLTHCHVCWALFLCLSLVPGSSFDRRHCRHPWSVVLPHARCPHSLPLQPALRPSRGASFPCRLMPFAGSTLKFTRILSYWVSPSDIIFESYPCQFVLIALYESIRVFVRLPERGLDDATYLLLHNVLRRTCVLVCLGVCARDCLKQNPGGGIPRSRICMSSLHFKAIVIMFPLAGTVSMHSLDGSHFKFCLFDCHATVSPHFSLHFSAH